LDSVCPPGTRNGAIDVSWSRNNCSEADRIHITKSDGSWVGRYFDCGTTTVNDPDPACGSSYTYTVACNKIATGDYNGRTTALITVPDCPAAPVTVPPTTTPVVPTSIPTPEPHWPHPNPDLACPQSYTTQDSFIYVYDPETVYGAEDYIRVSWWGSSDIHKGLIKFDLGSIPVNANISLAELRIFVNGWAGTPGFIDIYKIKRTWNEGQANWTLAGSGNNWEIAGVNGITDRDSAPITNTYIYYDDSAGYHYFNITNLVGQWVANPAVNKGVLLAPRKDGGENNTFYIDSSEASVAGARPCLIVQYSIPIPTPTPTPPSVPTPTPTVVSLAWFQTKDGDVYSHGNIRSAVIGTDYFSLKGNGGYPGVVIYGGTNAVFAPGTVSNPAYKWLANTGFTGTLGFYNYFYQLLGSPNLIAPPGGGIVNGSLPAADGVLAYNGNIETGGNINIGTKKVVILTSGNFLVKNKIKVGNGGSLVVITQTGIGVSEDFASTVADPIQGIFFTDGIFYSSVDDTFQEVSSSGRLVIEGSVIALSGIHLSRNLGGTANQTTPAEYFMWNPAIWLNSYSSSFDLWRSRFSWSEIAP
jgi:hypothetical protein